MKKQILSELNRFREIIGLPLLNEGIVPLELLESLAKAFGKSEEQFIESLGKGEMVAIEKVFDDLADVTGRNASDLIDDFKLDKLTDEVEDLFVVKMIQSNTPSIVEAAVKSYAKTKPVLVNLVNNTLRGIDSVISKASDKSYNEYLGSVKTLIDNSGLPQDTINYLKNEFVKQATSIRSKIKPKVVTPPSIDSVWSAAESFAKDRGKKLPSKEAIKAIEDELITEGITKQELIDVILEKGTDKKSMLEWLKTGRSVGSEIGGAVKDTAEGSLSLSKTALAGWGIGSLVVLGGIAFGFNWFGLQDALRFGKKSSTWKEIYKENFYSIPEDLQLKITGSYNADQATTDSSKPKGIKSFDWDEENETLFVNFFDGSKDTWKKMQTGDQTYWGKEGDKKENELEKETLKTEEEFKAAAMKGGFDVGKSFVKQTDTKYWGVDNDTTESTTEWNGTTFIVTSGHI